MAAAITAAMNPGSRVSTTPFRRATVLAVLTIATVVDASIPETRNTFTATSTKVRTERAGTLVSTLC